MTARPALADPGAAPGARQIFELRAWARAYLFAIGEYDLHQAVDVLQRDAERDGLIAAPIGQDEVQAILAGAFGGVRDDNAEVPVADDPGGIERNRR
jgi:hypothetical protein